jgi:hypothetical protein
VSIDYRPVHSYTMTERHRLHRAEGARLLSHGPGLCAPAFAYEVGPTFRQPERRKKRAETMVEFALPRNSQINGGKAWPKPANTKNLKEFRIYRWNPDDGREPVGRHLLSTATIAGRWFSTRSCGSRTRSIRR